MKYSSFTFLLIYIFSINSFAQTISPYYQLSTVNADITSITDQLKDKINESEFSLLGTYQVGGQEDLTVIAFTNEQTTSVCSKASKQGVMAAIYRIGLEKTANGIVVSTVNPEYQWRAYLTENYNASDFTDLNAQYSTFCKKIGNGNLVPFGGEIEADDLEDYHYMMGMPYYDDQVKIGSFDSHEQAVQRIKTNLESNSQLKLVYSLQDQKNQLTVFGIGLLDPKIGESHFLSIIGQSHVAAMPYELIVDGKEVKMLHGRFRFALYWPELTMGTFTKIMSTPGDVEDQMKQLVQ